MITWACADNLLSHRFSCPFGLWFGQRKRQAMITNKIGLFLLITFTVFISQSNCNAIPFAHVTVSQLKIKNLYFPFPFSCSRNEISCSQTDKWKSTFSILLRKKTYWLLLRRPTAGILDKIRNF